jgi:hypothetical protein
MLCKLTADIRRNSQAFKKQNETGFSGLKYAVQGSGY